MTPNEKSYLEMPLTKGKVAIVDAEDYAWLSQWKWCVRWCGSGWYAVRGSTTLEFGRRDFFMHREIMGLTRGDGKEVDHKNRNSLDNRRSNLRLVTRKENCANRRHRQPKGREKEALRLTALLNGKGKVTYWRGAWRIQMLCGNLSDVEAIASDILLMHNPTV